MTDRIVLGGISFYGYHGVSKAEQEVGRMFEIDCIIEADLNQPGRTDKLKETVNYHKVYKLIRETAEGKSFVLLEGLAERLAEKILDTFPIQRVTLKVKKVHPPVGGHCRYVEVEITRPSSDTADEPNTGK